MAKADINFDMYGHCVVCHECMIEERTINFKVTKFIKPNYREIEYLISDGSRMRVAVCQDCFDKKDTLNIAEIMATVQRGWEHEINKMIISETPGWNNEKKQKYLDRYNSLDIVCESQDKKLSDLQQKLKDHNDKKVKNGSGK